MITRKVVYTLHLQTQAEERASILMKFELSSELPCEALQAFAKESNERLPSLKTSEEVLDEIQLVKDAMQQCMLEDVQRLTAPPPGIAEKRRAPKLQVVKNDTKKGQDE